MTRTAATALALLFASPTLAQDEADLPELHTPLTLSVPQDSEAESAYPLLPEGAYLTDRLLRVVPVGTRATAAVFITREGDAPVRPMALLPCANTQAIEQLAASGDDSLRFQASGQVFTSRGLNYFLPLFVRVVSEPTPELEPAPAAEPDEQPPALAERTRDDNVAVEDLIRELEAATTARSGRTARTEAEERPIALKREGGVVTLRRGRLSSAGGGAPVFTFDTGINPDDPDVDPPMRLMPCSLTDEMERIGARRGDHVTMTVSGRVFLYDEANYLLPTMFFVNRAGEGGLSSAQ